MGDVETQRRSRGDRQANVVLAVFIVACVVGFALSWAWLAP